MSTEIAKIDPEEFPVARVIRRGRRRARWLRFISWFKTDKVFEAIVVDDLVQLCEKQKAHVAALNAEVAKLSDEVKRMTPLANGWHAMMTKLLDVGVSFPEMLAALQRMGGVKRRSSSTTVTDLAAELEFDRNRPAPTSMPGDPDPQSR